MKNNQFNAAWAKSTALYSKAAAEMGIGYPEMMVLYALETMGNLTQKQISENFGMQKQTVHTVIRALNKKGYIILQASAQDKREKSVILTQDGKIYAHKIIAPLQEIENNIYKKIGNERMQQICDTLELFNLLFEKEIKKGFCNE